MIYAEKHLSLLSRMGRDGLQLRFTGEFPEEILDQTCKKIEDMGLQEQIRKEEATQIQRELIQVPEFAELYQALCAHGIAVSVIQTMLHAASSYQEHLSQYPKEQVLEAAVLDLKPSLKFEYMKHYQPLVRYEEEEQAVKNVNDKHHDCSTAKRIGIKSNLNATEHTARDKACHRQNKRHKANRNRCRQIICDAAEKASDRCTMRIAA